MSRVLYAVQNSNKDKDKDKRHLERFSDPVTLKVTQLTIPDKMRNCNHDIEG